MKIGKTGKKIGKNLQLTWMMKKVKIKIVVPSEHSRLCYIENICFKN